MTNHAAAALGRLARGVKKTMSAEAIAQRKRAGFKKGNKAAAKSSKSNVARVSGGPAARLRDDGTAAQPALLGGASPTGNAGEAAPHCADAKRPRSVALKGADEGGVP